MKVFLLTDGEFTGLIRTLRGLDEEVGIIGFVSSLSCAHTAMLDKSYIAPDCSDDAYLPFLLNVIKTENVNFIFPVATLGLEYMARIKDEIFEKTGAFVISSPFESIETANDKGRLFNALKNVDGLENSIAGFIIASTAGELKKAFEYFENKGIQCITKPVRGENAEGFLKIVSESEYVDALLKGNASHIACKEMFASVPDEETLPIPRLVMPYLPGKEWDVDVLSAGGEVLAATVRSNSDMFGGLSACSTTENNPELSEICKIIVKELKLSYLACLSFREDENGVPKLLEINPRAMGSIHLSTLAGNNLVEKLLDIIENPEKRYDTVFTKPGFTSSLYYDIIPVSMPEKWRSLTADDRSLYESFYNRSGSRMTDMTFACRYAWDGIYNVKISFAEDCLVQASFDGDEAFMLMPLGNITCEKLERIIKSVKAEADSLGKKLRIICIDEKYLPLFDGISIPHGEAKFNDDFSDYLYDAEALRALPGRKYSKKRNHIHQFLRSYPDYEYETLDNNNSSECVEMTKKWAEQKGVDLLDTAESDFSVIKQVLRNREKLGVKGGAIRVGGKIIAFSIGSGGNNGICYIHFEKADADYEGAYSMINKLVLENEFADFQFVDREEDMGLENLRKAKQSYYPVEMIKKYSIRII